MNAPAGIIRAEVDDRKDPGVLTRTQKRMFLNPNSVKFRVDVNDLTTLPNFVGATPN